MPDSERSSRIEKQLFLRTLDVGLRRGGSRELADAMQEVFFPAGSEIYQAGEPASDIFFIMKGQVRQTKPGAEDWIFGARDLVGVLDMTQDRPRDRTSTALTDVRALRISAEDWFETLEDNFELTRGAVFRVSGLSHRYNLQLAPTGGFTAPAEAAAVHPTGCDDLAPEEGLALNLVERIILLRDIPAFRAASVQSLTALGGVLDERRFAPGSVLFRMGEPTDHFFIVVRGLVEIAREDPVIRAGFGRGTLVGGYSSLCQTVHQYTAHVMVPTATFAVRHEDYFDLMEDHFEMARSVLADMGRENERLLRRIGERRTLAREEEGPPSTSGATNP